MVGSPTAPAGDTHLDGRSQVRRFLGRGVAIAVAGVAFVALSACGPTVGNAGLRQPASPPTVWDNSDPTVTTYAGHSYLYGSSNNKWLPVREVTGFNGTLDASKTQWARTPIDAMPDRPAWVNPYNRSIWAPSVTRINGYFYVYFAGHRTGATDPANDQCIGRGVSVSATGPFTPEANPIYCGVPAERGSNAWGRGALDPEVATGPAGDKYLLVALSRVGNASIGSVRLDANGYPVGGINASPATMAVRQFPWHDGVDDGQLSGGFLENPSMVYEPQSNTWLLFYSAGDWYSSRYLTGFARCDGPVGPCVQDSRGPFLQAGSGRTGVGGLTAFDDGTGQLRVAYASWTAGHEADPNNPSGAYSRQVSFNKLQVSGSDPESQTVVLG